MTPREPRRRMQLVRADRVGTVSADRIFNQTTRMQAQAIAAAEAAAEALAAFAPFCDVEPELAERLTRQAAELTATVRVLRSAP